MIDKKKHLLIITNTIKIIYSYINEFKFLSTIFKVQLEKNISYI